MPPTTPDDGAAPRQFFVRPEHVRLDLTDGAWIIVKRELTAGEERAMYARMYSHTDDAQRVNLLEVGRAQVTAYLLDWNLTNDEGLPEPIRGLAIDKLGAVLDALSGDTFREIRHAVEAHIAREEERRAQEKKRRSAPPSDAKTSPSPVAVAGASSGSVN
jgi:hypothetical protein